MIITKNDLIQALQRNFKKKNVLLYLYYQDLFDSIQSSSFVRMKIHNDLGIELSKSHVDTIRYRMDKTTAKQIKAETIIIKEADFAPQQVAANQSYFTDPFALNSQKERNIIQPIK